MFYIKSTPHLGFSFENNKGNGDDDDKYGDSALYPLLPYIQPRYTTPHKAATMNNEENHQDGGKRKEKRKPNQFSDWNGESR